VGMKVYDLLAGRHNYGRSRHLGREPTLEHLPTVEPEGLRGSVLYYDGQFDDARLAINMAQTAVEQGASVANYCEVTDLTKTNGRVDGVVAHDKEAGETHSIPARSVINATGIFTDSIRQMDDPEAPTTLRPSQGVHVVLDRSFLPGESAIMVPKTDDGRVLFAIPWQNCVVVGSTETEVDAPSLEPRPKEEEISFLLEHAARYMAEAPARSDVRSVFAGIRPLVAPPDAPSDTAEISREHTVHVSDSELVTIAGGKWTTYRKMAEDTISRAAPLAGLDDRPSVTKNLPIHGWHEHASRFGDLADYGSDAPAMRRLESARPALRDPLDPRLPLRGVQVTWAARHEMARTVEDVLSRRTRSLIQHAEASADVAPQVAELMADELGRGPGWAEQQVQNFRELAAQYRIDASPEQVA